MCVQQESGEGEGNLDSAQCGKWGAPWSLCRPLCSPVPGAPGILTLGVSQSLPERVLGRLLPFQGPGELQSEGPLSRADQHRELSGPGLCGGGWALSG